jgi:HK97 family phage major capsid protein
MADYRFTSTEELLRLRAQLVQTIERVHIAAGDSALEDEDAERFNELNAQVDELDDKITQRQTREARLLELSRDPRHAFSGDGGDGHPRPAYEDTRDLPVHVRAALDQGLRAIERHRDVLTGAAGSVLERVVRNPADVTAVGARYIAAVGDPAYFTAFGKLVQDPMTAHVRMTPKELESVRVVTQVMAERAMVEGTGSAGGFAVPFELDPSILLSSNGALNPFRQISRVFTISTNIWKGVSADTPTAAYAAEATEMADASPVLVQPAITVARGSAFVPFSWELRQDWDALAAELTRLLTDARDILDASKFVLGTGVNEPVGLLNIGGTGSLSVTQRIQTNTAATYALGDVWKLKNGLANTRFYGSSTFMANPSILDTTYRFVGGNSTEPLVMPTRDGALAGKPVVESSVMVSTTTTASRIMVVGDFSSFYIADRLGITAEIVPVLFGATNRFPTGQSGLVVWWRTGSVVAAPNAFRYLEVL